MVRVRRARIGTAAAARAATTVARMRVRTRATASRIISHARMRGRVPSGGSESPIRIHRLRSSLLSKRSLRRIRRSAAKRERRGSAADRQVAVACACGAHPDRRDSAGRGRDRTAQRDADRCGEPPGAGRRRGDGRTGQGDPGASCKRIFRAAGRRNLGSVALRRSVSCRASIFGRCRRACHQTAEPRRATRYHAAEAARDRLTDHAAIPCAPLALTLRTFEHSRIRLVRNDLYRQ
jgi:hypothetical protein